MDGSIADSTMLRMRSGLMRAYQPAANATANDFFEELMRLPVTSSIETDEKDPSSADLKTLEVTHQPAKDDHDKPVADSAVDEEGSELKEPQQPQVSGCYAPWVPPQSLPQTEGSDTEGQTAIAPEAQLPSEAVSAPDTNTKANDVVIQPPVKSIDPQAATEPAVVVDAQAIKPINPQSSQQPAQPVVTARDTRRIKVRDEKSTSTSDISNHQTQTTNDTTSKPEVRVEAKQVKEVQPLKVEPATTPTEVQPTVEPKAEAAEDRRTDKREKWYQADNSDASSKIADLLASGQDANSQSKDSDTGSAQAIQELLNNNSADQAQPNDAVSQLPDTDATEIAQSMAVGATAPIADADSVKATTSSSESSTGSIAATGRSGHASSTGHTTGSHVSSARFNSGTSSAASAATSEGTEDKVESRQLSQQERVRLVQRVARSFSRLGPDGGQVTLKLHPPQLGVLNVSIKMEGQTMTARLQTETSAARDVILDNLPVLRERLSEQGIEVEKFQVEVATSDNATSGQQGQMSDSASGGAGSGRNDSPSTTIDQRRLRRDNLTEARFDRPPLEPLRVGLWQDKSLDVKA